MQEISGLISSGLQVTLIGMGVVFALLSILVGLVYAMSAICRLMAEPVPLPPPDAADDDELVGLISAAIHRYRSTHVTPA